MQEAGSDDDRSDDSPPVKHEGGAELPNVGEIIHRLREQRGMTLHQAAEASDLSASFLSAVERGKSDISLKRLARVAHLFNHDIGSLLGYTARRAKPIFVDAQQRRRVDRGERIDYEAIRLPGVDFELIVATLQPGAAFQDEISHEGVDIVYVTGGDLVLVYNGREHLLAAGECTLFSGGYPHTFRNDSDSTAQFLAVVTETVY